MLLNLSYREEKFSSQLKLLVRSKAFFTWYYEVLTYYIIIVAGLFRNKILKDTKEMKAAQNIVLAITACILTFEISY